MQISLKARALCANNCGQRLRRNYRNYCSNVCKTTACHRAVLEAFYDGTLKPMPFFNKIVRQHLLLILGERCQRCGWNERNPASGRIPVEIEHIDGNWRNIMPENLTLLCPNCHSLTITFRGLNRGNGRPGRPGTRKMDEASDQRTPLPMPQCFRSIQQVGASFAGSLFG
jgi:hypothetical protein